MKIKGLDTEASTYKYLSTAQKYESITFQIGRGWVMEERSWTSGSVTKYTKFLLLKGLRGNGEGGLQERREEH